jgi:hypothetical protein
MNRIFYNDWVNLRVNQILAILGKEWFAGKSVLDLGACYGDVGMELVRYGADVLFTDIRQDNLSVIPRKYNFDNFTPNTLILDQNKPYNLNRKFDLVLHFGVLYHIENWKQDLKCAMEHTSLMFLDTVVDPDTGAPDRWHKGYEGGDGNHLNSINKIQPSFTQESVEKVLDELGCKYIRLTSKELNTSWSWFNNQCLIRHVYNWEPGTKDMYYDKSIKFDQMIHYRRMWMIIK